MALTAARTPPGVLELLPLDQIAFQDMLDTIRRSFERFLTDSFFSAPNGLKVDENDTAWTITLDVPGVSREQLTLEVDGPVVRIATVADAPRQFKAAYELPEAIDVETTSAKLENGVRVMVPPFIEAGEKVVVDTNELTYVRRAE